MTIKELEDRTGMTRANIRYYEGEGLLTPKRLPNGYRDYSDEDARTLEKIKLLRQLHLDIDTIRLVQKGQLTLEQALFGQLNRLEGDMAAISRAAEVCRELSRSGVEYSALEPARWLKELEAPARPAVEPPTSPPKPVELTDPAEPARFHPWLRFFARSVDMGIYRTVFYVIALGVFRARLLLNLPVLLDWLERVLFLALTFALEPFWLHYWGWTPGKWLFGLKLRDQNGEKLHLEDAQERSWQVAWQGYRWNIPIWNLVTMWRCYKKSGEGQDCDWDVYGGYRYTKEERFRGWAVEGVVWAAAYGLFFAAIVMAGLHAELPLNRGELTVAQFVENYNDYAEMFDYSSRLDSNGAWTWKPDTGGGLVIYLDNLQVVDPEFTLEDGHVTAVTFRVESSDDIVYNISPSREQIAMLAMSGCVEGLNLFNFDQSGWVNFWKWQSNPYGDFEVDHRGLHVSQKVECVGYVGGQDVLLAKEGEEHFYRRTVTISVIDSE